MNNNEHDLNDIVMQLDERNLAHVLSAIALTALTSRISGSRPSESTCWWSGQGFVLKTAINQQSLYDTADEFLRRVTWIPGFGSTEQGTFVTETEIGSNPFISLAEYGQEKSPFKTFSGQISPLKLLNEQRGRLQRPAAANSWLLQTSHGTASWGFDCSVGSHAYDLGFSSNDEGSGNLDPIYPALELLSITAASFFASVQGWQSDANTVGYSAWARPVALSLVSFAVADRLDGLKARRYTLTNRGAAYGKGAAYRFFPEARPEYLKGDSDARSERSQS